MMDKYGLQNKKTGEIAKYDTSSNENGDFCRDVEYTLGTGERDWLVDSPENAEYARLHATPWYNAGYENPNHSSFWNPDDRNVVKVIVSTEPVEVKIPTMREFLKRKYKKSEPAHYNHVLEMLKAKPEMIYSLYDLYQLLGKYD